MKIKMKCIRCGTVTEHAIPGDPSHEIPCPDGCPGGRLTAAMTDGQVQA